MSLKENPFYVLDVSLSSDRKRIAEAADEIGFLIGSDKSSEAQSVLSNPAKRLIAELAWFPEARDADIAAVRNSISNDQPINTKDFVGYSKLNALIYNFGISAFSSIYELGFNVVYIDEQYSGISVAQVTEAINQARGKAGIAPVLENDVLEYHRTVVEELRRLLNDKLKAYDEKAYIEFATVIAEKYISDDRHNAGPILYDILDQYEIRMQSEIETRANQIIQYINVIKAEQSESAIRKSVPNVIGRVEAWDEYARPLQLWSKKTGLPHELSRELAYEIRGLIIDLNNKKRMAGEARDLASAMKSSFLDLGEFNELFTKDTETLEQIEKKNEKTVRLKAIETLLTALENDNKYLLLSGDAHKIKSYCDQTQLINNAIKDAKLGDQQEYQLRIRLCYSARNAALGKNHNALKPYDAKYVVLVLYDLFQDIPELKNRLLDDLNMINRDPIVERLTKELYESTMLKKDEEKQNQKKAQKPVNNSRTSGNQTNATSAGNTAASSNAGNSTRESSGVNWTRPNTSNTSYTSYTSNTSNTSNTTRPSNNYQVPYTETTIPCAPETVSRTKIAVRVIIVALVILAYILLCISVSDNQNNGKDVSTTGQPAERIAAETQKKTDMRLSGTEIKVGSVDDPGQGIKLSNINVKEYFDISYVTKRIDEEDKYVDVIYSIKPKSENYAKREGSSADIKMEIQLNLYETKDSPPFQTHKYTVILKKSNGYISSDKIRIATKKKALSLGGRVVSCTGTIGK